MKREIIPVKSDMRQKYEIFSGLLVEARKEAGLSQQEVAVRLGRVQSYVAKCEMGVRRMDVIEFFEFAKAIGADPLRLLKKLEQT